MDHGINSEDGEKVTPSELTLCLTGADVVLRKARESHVAPKHYQQAK